MAAQNHWQNQQKLHGVMWPGSKIRRECRLRYLRIRPFHKVMKFPFIFLFLIALSANAQDKNLEVYVQQQVKDMGDARTGQVNFGFLDSVLSEKRIVMLGESSHGTEEYSLLKKQLIQYLHEKLG